MAESKNNEDLKSLSAKNSNSQTDKLSNDIVKDEYLQLSSKYAKLVKDSQKLLKTNTELYEGYKQELIKNARDTILNNIKTTNQQRLMYSLELVQTKSRMQDLEKELKTLTNELNKTKAILRSTKQNIEKKDVLIHDLEAKTAKLNEKIHLLESEKVPFEEILKFEIERSIKTNSPLTLAMIGIKDYPKTVQKIDTFTTLDNFIFGILKYIRNSLHNIHVEHFEAGLYFILMPQTDIDQAKSQFLMLNKTKKVGNVTVSLGTSATALLENDNDETIMSRCFEGYNEIIFDPKNTVKIV